MKFIENRKEPGRAPGIVRTALVVLSLVVCPVARPAAVPESKVFPRPTLVPIPAEVGGVSHFVISLDGTWKFNASPPADFWRNDVDSASWSDVRVPVQHDYLHFGRTDPRAERPYAYRRSFTVPADFAGKRVIVRFKAVSDAARVWVNGNLVRVHFGTFTDWTCDITDFVKPGSDAWITVEVDDRPIGLAQFVSGGGIMRGVTLFAVPTSYISRFQVETDFDAEYRNASMQVWLTIAYHDKMAVRVRLQMKGPGGEIVPLAPDTIAIAPGANDDVESFIVANPHKWDAEHPNLYTLEATLLDQGESALEVVSRKVGFRQVRVDGNRLLINGSEVKLRGVWGNDDVAGLKALNINNTRQKYLAESFLEDADRLGIYVLDEVAVNTSKYGPESDPQFAGQWLSLISDLMERDRSHPSVIIWGLGNEAFHGPNVLNTFHYVKQEDKQRPAMFSWPNRVPADQELPYSIYSVHYPNLNDPNLNLGGYNVALWHSRSLLLDRSPQPVMPVLQDEYAHVILNEDLVMRDPNVRNFWGESIHRFWEKMFVTPGALGGDQFGLGLVIGHRNGPGTPEHFLIRKAYSPVRIATGPLLNPGAGNALEIPIKDWYDHTNLDELKVEWSIGTDNGSMAGPNVVPHAAGTLILPARAWRDGEVVRMRFVEPSGNIVDEFENPINPPRPELPRPAGPAPRLEANEREIMITGSGFRVVFDKYRGLMKEASVHGENIVVDGPFLTLLGSGLAYGEWWCDKLAAHIEGDEVVVDIKGNYAVIRASFQVRIDGTGLITTKYTIDYVPGEPPPPTYTPWNATSVGGYDELGVSYLLRGGVNRLSWHRNSLWSAYPDDHIGRPVGLARREPSTSGDAPWSKIEDPDGSGSNDWRSMKENIISASAWIAGTNAAATALSDGRCAMRLEVYPGYRALGPGVRLFIDNDWNYSAFGLGNYARPPILVRNGYSNTVYFRLETAPKS